ncbi:hypothetical protein GCM10011378_41490 [Hymenobacter glacieicola]|uniref:DNA (cytosine-5-)-methyltransferase n=1 Tax=Hymenobacter glacieicola TaxID=1562124 RepID=A0ABQ1X5N7_9BACT|nr:hypothetical protein GCM10011378_41490 [Hymenobacter glacieicola]
MKGDKSKLFYEYYRVWQECRPAYFLLENVGKIKDEDRRIITELLGVEPIRINSALVSAQNRDRWYWTNLPDACAPIDMGITLDQFVPGGQGAALRNQVTPKGVLPFTNVRKDGKSNCVVASYVEKLNGVIVDGVFRHLTAEECELLQTVPVGYTDNGLSHGQRLKLLGNGWTVDVIAHLLSGLTKVKLQQHPFAQAA